MTTSRIGFVSTRLHGTDGVSLEVRKWVAVLREMGHDCFFFAGQSEWPDEVSFIVPEAHFMHPAIAAIDSDLFDDERRSPAISERVRTFASHLKAALYSFVERFDIDLLIAENALSLPMNVPLGVALTEFIAETAIPTIAHHHDFWWERERYALSAADDYLRGAFPPVLQPVYHVVINSYAREQLALRTGASSMVIPNVMDFDTPPPPPDAYAADIRTSLGIPDDAFFILQPTRIVPRKRIEQSIEIVARLQRMGVPAVLVVSHASGDEGHAYAAYLREYAALLGVSIIYAADRIAPRRGRTAEGVKVYSLRDVYQAADLVTYPSAIEGFGNAFLEAIYYRRPILMNRYEIYKTDIGPKGFRVIHFDGFVQQECLERARAVLYNPALAEEDIAHNYELGRRFYSFRVLRHALQMVLNTCCGHLLEHRLPTISEHEAPDAAPRAHGADD
nr:glycosyltransferase family 4 protein [Ardenticatena sp.]